MENLRTVAVLNGMEVWSDKEGKIISDNESIAFEDGSYCNAKKNEIVNCGKGRIELRSLHKETGQSEVVIGPKEFKSSELMIENVTADIEIEPHEKNVIEVEVSGSERDCGMVKIVETGKKLSIDHQESPPRIIKKEEKPPERKTGRKSIIDSIRNFLATPIIPKVSIELVAIESRPAISIRVPKKTKITIKDTDGELNIGDIEGPLDLDIDNSYGAHIGKTKDAVLTSEGSGNIGVSRIDGTLTAKLGGCGDITIDEGFVRDLKIESNDQGHFEFGGTGQNANLALSGTGDITIEKVDGTLVANLDGYGDVCIESGKITDLKISTNDNGNFDFHGTAVGAELISNGYGKIGINEINGDLTATIEDSASGDIEIEKGNLKNLVVRVDGEGDFEFEGKTENSELTIEDGANGNIYVAFSKNRPYKDNDGYGDITVENWQKIN